MENAPIPLEGQFPLALRFWPSSPSMTMQPMNSCETCGHKLNLEEMGRRVVN